METTVSQARRMERVHSDIRGPLYQEALRMMAKGEKVLKLNTGNPAAFGFTLPESVREALLAGIDSAVPYCASQGMPAAREAILAYHRGKGLENIGLEDIFIGNGVSELAQMLILAMVNPGEEVLVPCPNYSLWSNSLYLAGANPVHYHCDEKAHWYPDAADIRRKITPKTRAILLINPNNPTGVLYPKEVLEEIIAIARENRLVLISDEIYDRLVMDGKVHHSTASLAPDLPVITMNGLSKSHIICGFRCGWMVLSGPEQAKRELRDALERLSSMRLCANTLTQLVIPAALADPDSTRQMLLPGGRLYEQRKAAMEVIESTDFLTCEKNDAAFYIFPRFDAKRCRIADDHEFGMKVLKEKHVLIVPGSGFGYDRPDRFRVVMLPEAELLRQAMRDIVDCLEKLAG